VLPKNVGNFDRCNKANKWGLGLLENIIKKVKLFSQSINQSKHLYCKQGHLALLKAKYCPPVAAASCTPKNAQKLM